MGQQYDATTIQSDDGAMGAFERFAISVARRGTLARDCRLTNPPDKRRRLMPAGCTAAHRSHKAAPVRFQIIWSTGTDPGHMMRRNDLKNVSGKPPVGRKDRLVPSSDGVVSTR